VAADRCAPPPPAIRFLAVGDAIDRSVPVVGDEQRSVFHHQHIDGPCHILVLGLVDEAGHELLHRLGVALVIQVHGNHAGAFLLGPVQGPWRAMKIVF
jgi:hypothetical protein